MGDVFRYFRLMLVALTLLHLGLMVRDTSQELASANGLVLADGINPVGGDFINMYSAAVLATQGRFAEIYDPQRFMAFERTIVPANIGIRMWAYPPTSLPLLAPLSLLGFWPALIAWSLLGLGLLAIGARRIGLGWIETMILVLSPTAISAVYYGQTGNAAAGLLLIALSAKRDGGVVPALSAALLTIKPQLGFLLPVAWLVRRQFKLIAVTVGLVLVLAGLSLWFAGAESWRGYVFDTLSVLNGLERTGEGPFTAMIPSTFMAVRLLTGDPTLAQWVHFGFAAAVAAFVVWQLTRSADALRQNGILLVATMLITPYLHIYDLAPIVCAGLLLMRRWTGSSTSAQLLICFAVLAAWAMPAITLYGNALGAPVGPLVLLALLVATAVPVRSRRHDNLEFERETGT